MRWYISYPVLAAGLAFGFETLFPSAPDLSQAPAINVRQETASAPAPIVVTASEMAEIATGSVSRLAAFSPGARLLDAEPPRPSRSVLDYLAQTLAPRESTPAAEAAPVAPVVVAEWKSAIVRDWEPAQAAAPVTKQADDRATRVALARDIQRELQRVGCYRGEIDGVWGGGSRRAVGAFIDRVNASLPTQEPDVFILSLLRAQTAAVCGASCPRGQSQTASGRCLPTSLVAQAEEAPDASASGESRWEPTLAEVAPERRPLPHGRMGIGGPRPDDVADRRESGWIPLTDAPARAAPSTRTAALDAGAADATADGPGVSVAAPSSFDTDAPPRVRRSRPSGSAAKARVRPAKRGSGSYRQVQTLFMHPLGRM